MHFISIIFSNIDHVNELNIGYIDLIRRENTKIKQNIITNMLIFPFFFSEQWFT